MKPSQCCSSKLMSGATALDPRWRTEKEGQPATDCHNHKLEQPTAQEPLLECHGYDQHSGQTD